MNALNRMTGIVTATLVLLIAGHALLRAGWDHPRVLIVTAHPDDESAFAVTVYKITHDLDGTVDLAVITNGEAGFKYSTLAEAYYGHELTDEAVGRRYLPTIRKRELMAAGAILGVHNYFFFDQQDNAYTQNVDSVLQYVWDVPAVTHRLQSIIQNGAYDLIFCLLPTADTHGHHKGATILALRTLAMIPPADRPVILGANVTSAGDTEQAAFTVLDGYPETKVSSSAFSFRFDRTVKFGFRDRLNYRIIVSWVVAEHKSQGAMQLNPDRGDYEDFWWFDVNDGSRVADVRRLFERLARVNYVKRSY